jgi:hypothetical protein
MIWKQCNGKKHIQTINLKGYRVVENQAKSFTRKLVVTQKAHDILEDMIEFSKPKLTDDLECLKDMYLLFKPFRYPPLKHGSRFGNTNQHSLFYVSLDLKTALSEVAFYRMSFIRASRGNIGNKIINMTSFKVNVATELGIDLTKNPFNKHTQELTSVESYTITQTLGTSMRQDKIDAFISYSARSNQSGKNLNVISPTALKDNTNIEIENTFTGWSCFATSDVVEFAKSSLSEQKPIIFNANDFCVHGDLPELLA